MSGEAAAASRRTTQAPFGAPREIFREVLLYWELRRIWYNAILAAVVVAWVALTWPHFRAAMTLRALLFLVVFALLANLCYCAAYLAEVPLQFSAFRTSWRRWRWMLWLVGTLFALVLANYWIADEIYPYVPPVR